ncbi:MAG: hypothetical protein AMXMBFR84_00730 [Candidatus Hydrogenedentota bacterium]
MPLPPKSAHSPSPESHASKRKIGEMLIEAGLISRAQLDEGLRLQQAKGGKIVEILIQLGYFDPDGFVNFLARQPGIASIHLNEYEVSRELLTLIPRSFVVRHEVFPIDRLGKLLTVGMVCPLDASVIHELESITKLRVKPMLVSPNDVRRAIERYYPDVQNSQLPPMATMAGMVGLSSSLKLSGVANLVKQIDHLPALPETVQRVQAATLDPLSSVRDVADIVVMDPPVAAKVLSVANSAFYGFPQRVDDVQLAISLLGLRETYSIVLSVAVLNVFEKSKFINYRSFWLDSMGCAAATRIVSKACGRKRQIGVFSAGLLHDIGRPALAEVAAEMYGRIDKSLFGLALVEAEEQVIGLCHNEAGYLLAENWSLPPEISAPIRFHHKPELAVEAKEAVAIVSIADALTRATGPSPQSKEEILASIDVPRKILDMDPEIADAVYEEFVNLHSSTLRDAIR